MELSCENSDEVDSWKASFLRAGVYPEKAISSSSGEDVSVGGCGCLFILLLLLAFGDGTITDPFPFLFPVQFLLACPSLIQLMTTHTGRRTRGWFLRSQDGM